MPLHSQPNEILDHLPLVLFLFVVSLASLMTLAPFAALVPRAPGPTFGIVAERKARTS